MEPIVLTVEGMSCNHCVGAIKAALLKVVGVNEVEVSLENKQVTVKGASSVKRDDLVVAIEVAGYDVVNV